MITTLESACLSKQPFCDFAQQLLRRDDPQHDRLQEVGEPLQVSLRRGLADGAEALLRTLTAHDDGE